jgi:ribosomal 50S subunit-recycling heat shock protein
MSSLSLKRFKFAIWTLSFIPAAAFVYPKSFFTSTSYRLDNMKAKPLSIMIESKVIVRASSNDANYGEENEEEEELLGARGSMATFTVEPQEAGQRLDMFLAARVGGQSRSYLASLIADGHVVDPESGRAVNKKAGKVKQGDTLSVTFTMNDLFTITAEDIPLDIIYEDEVRAFPFVFYSTSGTSV